MTRLFEARPGAPYLIAEIGSNIESLAQALRSIEVAKDVGASAAKFQLFSARSLYGVEQASGKYSFPLDALPTLREHADKVGIELGCTAFAPHLLNAVDPFVHWHKIASSDCSWPQLLDAAASTGKPMIISLGATDDEQRHRVWEYLHTHAAMRGRVRSESVYWLKCVAAYPADFTDLHDLPNYDGLSDHSLGYTVPVLAAINGARVIEKHFTAFPDLDTPDRPHSLTPDQFAAMVKLIRTGEAPDQEREFRLRHKRRLIATTDIPQGGILRYGESFGAYRSLVDDTRGLSPFRWEEVEGKKATIAIKRGTPIGEGDYE